MPEPNEHAIGRRLGRPCKDHERPWGNRCVDKNLQDAWLESLNELQAFKLISICEGHPRSERRRGSRHPHINLRLKESLLPSDGRQVDDHRESLQRTLIDLFCDGETRATLEFRLHIEVSRRQPMPKWDVVVNLHAQHQPSTDEMDGVVRDWFNRTVQRVKTLDIAVVKILGASSDAAGGWGRVFDAPGSGSP